MFNKLCSPIKLTLKSSYKLDERASAYTFHATLLDKYCVLHAGPELKVYSVGDFKYLYSLMYTHHAAERNGKFLSVKGYDYTLSDTRATKIGKSNQPVIPKNTWFYSVNNRSQRGCVHKSTKKMYVYRDKFELLTDCTTDGGFDYSPDLHCLVTETWNKQDNYTYFIWDLRYTKEPVFIKSNSERHLVGIIRDHVFFEYNEISAVSCIHFNEICKFDIRDYATRILNDDNYVYVFKGPFEPGYGISVDVYEWN